jgi:hypothetical protein
VLESIFHQDYTGYTDWMLTRDNPYGQNWGEVYRNIQLNYEKMRRLVLAEGYCAVWIVESDTIPPHAALRKLLEIDAPVVSGLYVLRHGSHVPNVMQHNLTQNVGSAMAWSAVGRAWGQTVPVSGGCMGCLLIRRPVLEHFSFVLNSSVAPDVPLMQYCWTQDFRQMARLDVVCGHKQPDGSVLWPQDFIEQA